MIAERLLVLLLRVSAVILLLATFAIVMPSEWMTRGDELFDLRTHAGEPLFEYLTRSLSAMYASLGVLSWVLASDLARYRPLITLWGWFHIGFGVVILGIDTWAGMPWYWTAIEGPGLVVAGSLTLYLLHRVPFVVQRGPAAHGNDITHRS